MRWVLLLGVLLAVPGAVAARVFATPDWFAGVETTADGGFLHVRLAHTTGDFDISEFPEELQPGHPRAFPCNGIYRPGERQPVIELGQRLWFGSDRLFMSADGAAILALATGYEGGLQHDVVEFWRDGEVRCSWRLPYVLPARNNETTTGGDRPPEWRWRSDGGVATAVSFRGDFASFLPGTGQCIRVGKVAADVPSDAEIAAFEAALGKDPEPRKRDD